MGLLLGLNHFHELAHTAMTKFAFDLPAVRAWVLLLCFIGYSWLFIRFSGHLSRQGNCGHQKVEGSTCSYAGLLAFQANLPSIIGLFGVPPPKKKNLRLQRPTPRLPEPRSWHFLRCLQKTHILILALPPPTKPQTRTM